VEPWSIDQPHTQGIMIMFNIKQMSELCIWESMTNHAILPLREQNVAPKLQYSIYPWDSCAFDFTTVAARQCQVMCGNRSSVACGMFKPHV